MDAKNPVCKRLIWIGEPLNLEGNQAQALRRDVTERAFRHSTVTNGPYDPQWGAISHNFDPAEHLEPNTEYLKGGYWDTK